MEAAEVIAGGGAGDFALYRYPTTADLPGGDGNGLTLWYALYDTERRTMSVSFYLRDSDHGEIRTPQLAFSLQPARARPGL